MSKKLYPEEDIQAIANAIRALNGSSDTYAVGDMADAIEMPDDAYYLKETEADNPLVITDGEELNAQSCVVEFEPIQDLHGYDNPWPAGGGKNKFDKDSVTVSSITFENNAEHNTITRRGFFYHLPVGTYTMNCNSTTATSYIYANVLDSNGSFKENVKLSSSTESWAPKTVTLSNGDYLAIFKATSGQPFPSYDIMLQIELGETATDYAPYSNICPISGRDSLVLNRCGKNVFNKNAKNTNNGYIANQYLNFQGYPFTPSTTPENWFISEYIYVKPNTKYTISGLATSSSNAPSICEYNSDKSFVIGYSYSNRENFTITTSSTTRFIRMSAGLGQTYWDAIQLEEGDSVTSYNAYNGQTHTATFLSTVYGGSYDFVSGKAYNNRSNKIDLGSASWTYYSNRKIFALSQPITGISNISSLVVCEAFKTYALSTLLNNQTINGISVGTTGTYDNRLVIRDLRYTSASDFKTAMSGIYAVYGRETPQEIALTPEIIELLKDNNVFTTDGKTVKVRYLSKHI